MKWKVFLIFMLRVSSAKIQLGDLIPTCNVRGQNLNSCVVNSANALIPTLVKGIRDLDFPPVDPLKVAEMSVDQSNAPISVKLNLLNTVHTGLSTLKFYSASMHSSNNLWILNATLPQYSLTGEYKGRGRLLLLPINGEGDANFTYLNTKVDFVLNGAVKPLDGDVMYSLTGLKVFLTFDKCYISMTNLFQSSKQLSEAVDQFMRNNSKEVSEGLKASLERVYSSLYLSLLKKLLGRIPMSQLFEKF